jgi:hypothetical protein
MAQPQSTKRKVLIAFALAIVGSVNLLMCGDFVCCTIALEKDPFSCEFASTLY